MVETAAADGAFNLSNHDRLLMDRKQQHKKTSLVSGRLDLAACRMMADSCGLRRSVVVDATRPFVHVNIDTLPTKSSW